MADKTTPTRWDYRSESRKDYGRRREHTETAVNCEQLNAGSLMRIADATEAMARNYSALIDERDRYKRWYESERLQTERLARQVRALRGHLTRMKRRALASVDGEAAHG